MKVNINQDLFNIDNERILDEKQQPVKLKTIIKNALINPLPGDDGLSADEKIKQVILAKQALLEDEVTWTAEDISFVKTRINRAYPSPVIVSEAYRILECEGKDK